MTARQFPCRQCGAQLDYDPSVAALKCSYCGAENAVPHEEHTPAPELDFEAWLAKAQNEGETVEHVAVKCGSCGASCTLGDNLVADVCPFCGANIVATGEVNRIIKPGSVLPFKVDRAAAEEAFRAWVASRWFAPSSLTRMARREGRLAGMFVPFWTYDCDTRTAYTGERGEHYWATETYTTTVNGRTVTRTRQVQRTRWYPASGVVFLSFDDLLVPAGNSLPQQYLARLEPWDLGNLEPYRDDYLSGFRAELYQTPLAKGFAAACAQMVDPIRKAVIRDIGGDEQRVDTVNTAYSDITFKHLLLPLWICAYRFRERPYRVLINARTGEVQGERPYSAWKIALLVIVILLLILAGIALVSSRVRGGRYMSGSNRWSYPASHFNFSPPVR